MVPSVVVDDLYVMGVAFSPREADSPLVINSNAPLPCPVPLQLLESVRRWNFEIFKGYRRIEHTQLPKAGPLQVGRELAGALKTKQPFGFIVRPRFDHGQTITAHDNNVKRYRCISSGLIEVRRLAYGALAALARG